LSGKFVTRYDIVPGFAIRGGVNSGFRAPSLGQTGFSTTQNTATIIGSERVRTTSKFLAVDSQAAQALGAEPLKPEKSLSYTAGATLELGRIFRLTVDGYVTHVKDRIVKSDFIGTTNNGGTAVADRLRSNGINDVDSAQFFFNGLDTSTRGLDIVTELTLKDQALGTFRPSAAFSFAKTVLDEVARTPSELANLNVTLIGRQVRSDITQGAPATKLVLGANWAIWRFKTDLRLTNYGSYWEASTTAGNDRRFSGKWITDLDVGFGLTDNVTLSVGAYNLFDVYPDKNGIIGNEGSGQYGSFAPFGLSGGFYYARVGVNI
ncbi:MAG: hypothetical protein RL701_1162, partial [Pseudomonadota bacterium]